MRVFISADLTFYQNLPSFALQHFTSTYTTLVCQHFTEVELSSGTALRKMTIFFWIAFINTATAEQTGKRHISGVLEASIVSESFT